MPKGDFDHRFINGSADGRFLAVNLSQLEWVVGEGLPGQEENDIDLRLPTESTSMFDHHHVEAVRAGLKKAIEDEPLAEALRAGARDHGALVVMLPRKGKLRHDVYQLFDEQLDRRFGVKLQRFEVLKFYVAEPRADVNRFVRKMKGARHVQTVINLDERFYRYFRFHGKQIDDVKIDSILDAFPESIDDLRVAFERALRMMEMDWIRRIRTAAEEGIVVAIQPANQTQRDLATRALLNVMASVPGGGIDLEGARSIRIRPALTTAVSAPAT